MNSTDYLVAFLLNYDVMIHFGSYKKLLDAIYTSQIPTDLLLIKFFEYAVAKEKTIDEIYSMIVDEKSFVESIEDDKKTILNILEIVKSRKVIFKEYNDKECKTALTHFPIVNQIHKQGMTHAGQPLPDPEKGRPRLGWNVCMYKNCKIKFAGKLSLIEHLQSCNAYTQGYHYYHEIAVFNTQLTPAKVLQKKITKCPSYACNHKDFGSPHKLIKHLQLLGIEPFWVKGMKFEDEDNSINKSIPEAIKLFVSEMCILCLSDNPAVLTGECRHHVYCYDCFTKNKHLITNVCPVCKAKVEAYYPYC